ncbi:MAG: CoB--CoM heterodisulfide reductase iron-sulfur subunit A family protein [Spirochaetales bacterium]|nr:CoB--CoM heterodisulfide reductase iron-sulfur subunit A family protein [Spirochaetales bacterium]
MTRKKVVIVGAGISGMTVASNLSKRGIVTMLIDKNPYPGGEAVFYGCKATDSCMRCGVCLLRDALCELKENDTMAISFSSTVRSIKRHPPSGYILEIEVSRNYIDPRQCIACGLCQPVCPEDAIKKIPGWTYYIDSHCTACGECVDRCPVGAVSLENRCTRMSVHADSIVIATGFEPYDPARNLKWGYGRNPQVITATDLERCLYDERYPGVHVSRIAFIQCVGSRNVTEGVSQCSRICCAYALRMANKLTYDRPGTAVDFYYMDIQGFGKQFPDFMANVNDSVSFIRSSPVSVATEEGGKPIVRFESPETHACIETAYDLLVLSHGLCPRDNAPNVAELFGLDQDVNGFFNDFPADGAASLRSGIFTAGTCRGPMRIDECITDATAVSRKIFAFLEGEAAG